MSLSTHTLKRLSTIKTGLREGLTRPVLGKRCGVTEKTIDRDIKAWVNSGLFETWIREEFLDLHNYVRDADPVEAYRQVSKLVAKMITQKIEAKTEHREIKLSWEIHDSSTKDSVSAAHRAEKLSQQ